MTVCLELPLNPAIGYNDYLHTGDDADDELVCFRGF